MNCEIFGLSRSLPLPLFSCPPATPPVQLVSILFLTCFWAILPGLLLSVLTRVNSSSTLPPESELGYDYNLSNQKR